MTSATGEAVFVSGTGYRTLRIGFVETLLLSLLVGACFLPAEVISTVMFVLLLFLLFDPFVKEQHRHFQDMKFFALILLIGIAGSSGKVPRDIAKDIWYVGNAAITLWLGFLAAKKLDGIKTILRILIGAAVIVSLIHLCRFAIDPAIITQSAIDIRTVVGVGYLLPALGIGVLLADCRYHLALLPVRYGCFVISALCLISIVLSYSRPLWLGVFTFFFVQLVIVYYRQVRRVAVVASLVLLAVMVYPIPVEELEYGTETTFTEKAVRSLTELRVSDYEDMSDIHRNWRGFESYRAIETYADGNTMSYLFGKGFGTSVDLGLTMILMDEEFDSIPVLHNGYLYLLLKTGIVGVVTYLCYLFLSLRRGTRLLRLKSAEAKACGFLIIALALFMLESTLVISGMFNKGWVFPATLLLGMLLGKVDDNALPA